jgi:hypothetical protein
MIRRPGSWLRIGRGTRVLLLKMYALAFSLVYHLMSMYWMYKDDER